MDTIAELKKDLAAAEKAAKTAAAKPAELEAKREILLSRRATAAQNVTEAAAEKRIAVRKRENGEYTSAECDEAIASAQITHDAAGIEMQTAHDGLIALEAEQAAAAEAVETTAAAVETARAALMDEIIVAERATAAEALTEGLVRLDQALRLRSGYSRKDLLDAVGRIIDRGASLAPKAKKDIEDLYL
jgi:hypothetical protein